MRKALSVVIVTHQSARHIAGCLDSIDEPAEVIVVDAASTDGTLDVTRRVRPDAATVALRENGGYARGLNAGLARAVGEAVALANADVRFAPGCLRALAQAALADERVSAAGPLLVDGAGRAVNSARSFPSLAHEACEHWLIHRLWRGNPVRARALRTDLGPDRGGDCDYLVGAALVASARALRQVGPFDERFFLYYEETEWFLRASRRGLTARFVPEARATHLGGGSSGPRPRMLPVELESRYRYELMSAGPAAAAALAAIHASGALLRHALWSLPGRERPEALRENAALLGWLLGRFPDNMRNHRADPPAHSIEQGRNAP